MNNNFKNNFIDRQFKHIRLFQDNMILLEKNLDKLPFKIKEWELIRVCLTHDSDKFNDDVVEKRIEVSKYWYCEWYNIKDENLISVDEVNKFSHYHYEKSRHHIEFYNNNKDISYIALCEMACDMSAICQELSYRPYSNYLVKNRDGRFKILSDLQIEILIYILHLIWLLYTTKKLNK